MEAAPFAGFLVIWLVFMVLAIGSMVLWIIALIQVVKLPDHAYRYAGTEKTTWILIVVLAQGIGALVWWFGPRKRVLAAAEAHPVAPMPPALYGPPPGWYPDPAGGPGRAWWDGQRWSPPPPSS